MRRWTPENVEPIVQDALRVGTFEAARLHDVHASQISNWLRERGLSNKRVAPTAACLVCGKVFKLRTKWRVCCSLACARQRHAAPPQKRLYGTKAWREKRSAIIAKLPRCVRCLELEKLTVHHIIPVAAGGKEDDENLVTLCQRCHVAVEHATQEIFDCVEDWTLTAIMVTNTLRRGITLSSLVGVART